MDWLEADLVERKSESRLVEIMDGICPPRDYRCREWLVSAVWPRQDAGCCGQSLPLLPS